MTDLAGCDWLLGLNENRGEALIDADRNALAERLQPYFDASLLISQLPPDLDGLRGDWARFEPERTRAALLPDGFAVSKIVRFTAKPFDSKWAYVDTRAKLWNEARPSLVQHASRPNRFMMARCRAPRAHDGAAFYVGRSLADQHALHKDAYLIPLVLLREDAAQTELLPPKASLRPNLSELANRYLADIGVDVTVSPEQQAEAIWLHALATGYTARYLKENADGIRLDWPRIPLPGTCEATARLGRAWPEGCRAARCRAASRRSHHRLRPLRTPTHRLNRRRRQPADQPGRRRSRRYRRLGACRPGRCNHAGQGSPAGTALDRG